MLHLIQLLAILPLAHALYFRFERPARTMGRAPTARLVAARAAT